MSEILRFFNTHKPKSSPGIIDLALRHTKDGSGEIAIDLCCGAGSLTGQAATRGFRAYGVDISSQFIGTAPVATHAAGFVNGDVMSVPFKSASARLVYCIDSLQYFDNPDQVLAEMARLLEPGGVLIFSTQNNYNPAGIKKIVMEKLTGRNWSPWLAHPVENRITYPWLMQALERHGFAVEYVRGRQFLTAWVSLLPAFIRNWTPWPGKHWRSPAGIAQRTNLPDRFEESGLARFAMMLFIRARKQ